MRIAFEGTTLQPERTGVGYYSEHLLRHLAATAPDDEFVVVSNRKPVPSQPLPARIEMRYPSRQMMRLAWMQTVAPSLLEREGADVAHFTNGLMPLATTVPTVITIHDMSLTLFPECHPRRRRLVKRPFMRMAASRAAAIITPSSSAKADLCRIYGVDPARVHVVYEAAAPEFEPVTDAARLADVRRRHDLPEQFVLYVGAIEPRKNLPRLLEAFAARHHAGDLPHRLVFVGPYGWLSEDFGARIEQLGLSRAVHFTGYVPFADLPAIYSLAEMFVFPSLYEGFGLPVAEAMACGAPTIIGATSSLTEIGGDAVSTVDPFDVTAIGDAMVALANDEGRRRDLSARGVARAREFSWQRAAADTLSVYRTVVARATEPALGLPARIEASSAAMAVTTPAARSTTPADVLMGEAYYLRFDPKLFEAQQPYPPLGTLYAAAVLRRDGLNVAVFDAMLAASEAEWAQALEREQPRIAVIYEDSFNYLSKMCLLRMRAAALAMIDEAVQRNVPVLVSGSDATDHPEIYLQRGAAAVIIGEGETTLSHAVAALRSGTPLESVRGLCLQRQDRLVRTGAREFIKSLDELPRPAWDLIDIGRYQQIWRSRHHTFSMNLATTRGCPYSCNWCAKPIYGQRYTVRSPHDVVEEMAWLKATYGPEHLWIVDDIFGLKPGWIETFAALATARDAVIPFKCLMRADQVTTSVVDALKAARCRTVWIGAESGSQKVLDAMDKGTQVDDVYRAASLLKAAGIEVGFFLQFGYPGETLQDIRLTERMVRRCKPDDIGISVSYPLPGTPFYEKVRAELGVKQNWVDSADLETMYLATFSPAFYRVLHSAVHAEFRLRKIGTLLAACARPWTLRAKHARQAAALAGNLLALPLLRWQLRQLARGAAPEPPAPLSGLGLPDAMASHQDA